MLRYMSKKVIVVIMVITVICITTISMCVWLNNKIQREYDVVNKNKEYTDIYERYSLIEKSTEQLIIDMYTLSEQSELINKYSKNVDSNILNKLYIDDINRVDSDYKNVSCTVLDNDICIASDSNSAKIYYEVSIEYNTDSKVGYQLYNMGLIVDVERNGSISNIVLVGEAI